MQSSVTPNNEKQDQGRIGRRARDYARKLDEWEAKKPSRAGRACYRAYSQLFIPFAILVLLGMPLSGREFIWNVDGLHQYYPFFLHEGAWIRGIVSGLVSGNGLQIPLWEWHSGYGTDTLTTFDVFFDPLNLVSAITPPAISEWVFQLLVVVRLYLAGLSFVFYCRTRGVNRTGTVLGALLYALCGAGLVGVRWVSGLHAFILFPTILAGAERVLAHGKPWVFVASFTLLAIVSYYFTFMATILLIGYLVVRVVMVERPHLTVGRFFRWMGVFAGLSVLCALLAGFVLVPSAIAIMGMDRVTEGDTVVPLVYGADYYLRLITGFVSITYVGSDTHQGFGGLAFFACVALFLGKGENRELKIVFIVLTAFFLFPAVGSFFNGMNYATNRWAWAYALCVAFILARMTPRLLSLESRDKRVFAVCTVVYAAILLIPPNRTEANMAGFAALLFALIVLLTVQGREARSAMLFASLAVTLGVSGFYFLSASEGGQATQHSPFGSTYGKLTTNSVNSIPLAAGDESWWRYDATLVADGAGSPMNRIGNNSLVLGLNGFDFYNSIYNNGVDAFHTELGLVGTNINFWYRSLQDRSDLMALLGVKYYLFRNDGTDAVPYNYSMANEAVQRTVLGYDYRLLRADSWLPLGFTFDKAITHEDYLGLTIAQRQQALLQAVVLNGGTQAGGAGPTFVDTDRLTYEDATKPFTVTSTVNATVEEGRIVASAPNASITLSFEGTANADTFLYLSGLTYRSMKPSEFVSDAEEANMPWYRRTDLLARDLSSYATDSYGLAIKNDASTMTCYLYNKTADSHMFGGKDTWLAELGYAETPAHEIKVTFDVPGEYRFNDMQVITETHGHFARWMSDRSKSVLENAQTGCNALTGTVNMDEPGTLLMTVAYSDGWSARVDGQPAELLRGDTAFMALNLPAGQHEIELSYFTPGLATGLATTGVGIVLLVALVVFLRLRSRRQGAHGDTAMREADEAERGTRRDHLQ